MTGWVKTVDSRKTGHLFLLIPANVAEADAVPALGKKVPWGKRCGKKVKKVPEGLFINQI